MGSGESCCRKDDIGTATSKESKETIHAAAAIEAVPKLMLMSADCGRCETWCFWVSKVGGFSVTRSSHQECHSLFHTLMSMGLVHDFLENASLHSRGIPSSWFYLIHAYSCTLPQKTPPCHPIKLSILRDQEAGPDDECPDTPEFLEEEEPQPQEPDLSTLIYQGPPGPTTGVDDQRCAMLLASLHSKRNVREPKCDYDHMLFF